MSSDQTPSETFALTASRGFTDWLAGARASLAFTTYQAGKVFLIGLRPDGGLVAVLAVSDPTDKRRTASSTALQDRRERA